MLPRHHLLSTMLGKRERDLPPDERATPVKRAAGGEARKKVCVVGVDFGTSRTGYAYAFVGNGEIESRQPGGQEAGKTHSSILFDAQGRFKAFGAKAREMYFNEDENGLFFENYKMGLDSDLNAAPFATALNGQKLPLLTVITATLEFVRKEAVHQVNRSQLAGSIGAEDIQWIVTVPAIWKDKAKGLMREAAWKAGMISSLASDGLQLALEPEAACMACEEESKHMKVGDSFMVLDCGGGTVDITTYRLTSTEPWTIEEIAVPSGGPWGSTFVDAQFENFVKQLIGTEAFGRFNRSGGWVDLMESWEAVKLGCNDVESFDSDLTRAINLAPVLDYLEEGQTLSSLVTQYNRLYGANLQTRRSTTVLVPLSKIQHFFRVVVDKIEHHVMNLLAKTPVDYILLVGGFAESKILYHRIRNAFEHGRTKVVVPTRPQVAVVKGAVSFNLHGGKQIQSRLARFTYGYETEMRYDASRPHHRLGSTVKRVLRGQEVTNVQNIFCSVLRAGTNVAPGSIASSGLFFPAEDGQAAVPIHLYSSIMPDVNFTNEEHVQKIGSVTIPMKVGQEGTLQLHFGTTEIEATVENKQTGQRVRTAINYSFSDL